MPPPRKFHATFLANGIVLTFFTELNRSFTVKGNIWDQLIRANFGNFLKIWFISEKIEKLNSVRRLFKMMFRWRKYKVYFLKNQCRRGKTFWKHHSSLFIFHIMVTKLSYFMIPWLGTIVRPLLFMLSHCE